MRSAKSDNFIPKADPMTVAETIHKHTAVPVTRSRERARARARARARKKKMISNEARNLVAVLQEILFYVPTGHKKLLNRGMQMLKGLINFENPRTRTSTYTFTCTCTGLQKAVSILSYPLLVPVNVPVLVLVRVHEKRR
jgi:hypothetical protein